MDRPPPPFTPAGWPDNKRERSLSVEIERPITPLSVQRDIKQSPATIIKKESHSSPENPTPRSRHQVKSPSLSFMHDGSLKEESASPNGIRGDTSDDDLFVEQDSSHRPEHLVTKNSIGIIDEPSKSEGDGSESDELPWPVKPKPAKRHIDVDDELPRSPQGESKAQRNSEKTGEGAIANKRQKISRKVASPANRSHKVPAGIKKKPSHRASKGAKRPIVNSGIKGISGDLEFMGYDPIAAYHAEPELDEAPSIEASTKKKQLADLVAGAPPGSDKRRNKADANAIEKATRVFGRGKVKAKDGFWMLDGMKTRKSSFCVDSPQLAWAN